MIYIERKTLFLKKKVSENIYFAFNTAVKHIPKINNVINRDIQKIIL